MSLERFIAGLLDRIRLHRIRGKIIGFSLLATLIPSLTMGWLSYRNNRQVLEEKINQELLNFTSHAARGLEAWLAERGSEIRVFASSYEVSENLALALLTQVAQVELENPLERLETYLRSVEVKFGDYSELLVVDLQGKVLASSTGEPGQLEMPEGWLELLLEGEATRGDHYWDEALGVGVLPLAEPVRDQGSVVIGGLVAKLNFDGITEQLTDQAPPQNGALSLVTRDGVVLASSKPLTAAFGTSRFEKRHARTLFANERLTREFTNRRGRQVVGTLEALPEVGWGIVAEIDRAAAYAQIVKLRNLTFVLIVAILIVVGLAAYALGLTIVRPLDRLAGGAAQISAGDLDVKLPIYSEGELGATTRAFNRMARRLREVLGQLDRANQALRQKNEDLRELSIRDPLTGLYNHKHMMETLVKEDARSRRYGHSYSILMIDIDEFKNYNDTFGHLEGDRALVAVANTLADSLRTQDYSARYGGEEFLVILPETGLESAAESAERIRRQIEEKQLGSEANGPGITVSIGVASFPENGHDPEDIIGQADSAMYGGKRGGRNRVEIASGMREPRRTATSESG